METGTGLKMNTDIQLRATARIDDEHALLVNEFAPTPDAPLFCRPEFFHLHAGQERDRCFQLARRSDGKIVAVAPFFEADDDEFVSPRRGSFGGYYFLDDELSLSLVEAFVAAVESELLGLGMRGMRFSLPPQSYRPHLIAILANVLLRSGYSLAGHELSYSLEVSGEPFIDHLHQDNRRNVRRCRRAGYTCRQLDGSELRSAYDVIAGNRARRGYPMTMSWDALRDMNEKLPRALCSFGVLDGDKLVAAGICVNVSSAVLYVFYWGELDGYRNPSTITLLAETIYDHCLENGIGTLDAGTSTVDGEPNHGLIRFKRSLGFRESLKLSFAKRFPDEGLTRDPDR